MKPSKAVFKSYRKVINKIRFDKTLVPNQNHGEIVIPIGSDDVFIELPHIGRTQTFNLINTSEMTGNITLKTRGGKSMKGLVLNTSGGSVSIDPIRSTTDQITLENSIKDGSFIQTLSNGSEWFIWSVATGGTLSIRTGGINSTFTPTTVLPTPADITNVAITSDVRFVGSGLEARHDLTFSGEGEPGATLTITEDGDAINPIVIVIPSTGSWSVTRATDLPNATYTFDFNPTSGNGVQNKSFTENTGPITFTVPSAFSPDPAEVVDFAAGASATKPDGTPITVTVDSTAWNSSLVHGDTFNIIYSITDAAVNGGVTVSQTVSGEIVDDTPPAAPVISAASIANINELSANGTAEPNKTITLFQDSLALSPTVTSDGGGNWSFGPVALSFNSNFTLKAQASEDGVDNPNRSAFVEYSPAFNYVQPQVQKPTLTIDGETKSTWSNTAGTFTLRGTTEAGSTISIKNGSGAATLAGGPSVVGTDWTATMAVANESISNLTAVASLANHLPNTSDPFGLLIDRVAPVITLTGGAQTVGLPNVGSNLDSGFSASDSSSGVATSTSNWDTQVSTTTEGTYTVTYNATDVAGNSATPVTRDVTVTTEVIIPVITGVTANINGTFTITGTVTGTYADNLTVQVTIGDSNSGSPVFVTSGTFTHTTSAKSPGTYAFKAKTINSVGDESSLTPVATDGTIAVPDTTPPVIVITNDADDSVITNQTVSITEGDTFSFTATATDNIDGDISGNITQGGHTLDTDTVGTYNLTFDVSDSASPTPNTDSATLTVEVAAATASFIEDITEVINTITSDNNLSLTAGVVSDTSNNRNHGLLVNLDTSGVVDYGSTGEAQDLSFTVSFWMKRTDNTTGNKAIFGKGKNSGRPFALLGSFSSTNMTVLRLVTDNGTAAGQITNATSLSIPVYNTWNHFAIVAEDLGSSGVLVKAYVNGVKRVQQTRDPGAFLLPPQSAPGIRFGAITNNYFYGNASIECDLDSMQIVVGTALAAAQVEGIYNHTDRNMTIETAAAIDVIAPVITVRNADTLADITGTPSAPFVVNITEGDVFNYEATATDNVDGDISGNIVTTGDTLDTDTPGTYNLTFSVSDDAGNVADQKALQVVVAEGPAFTIRQLINLTGTSTSGISNHALGSSWWKDTSDTAPTANGLKVALGTHDAEYGKLKSTLDTTSMSVGETRYVQWRRGRGTTKSAGSEINSMNLSLIDFSALETLYGTTLSNSWTPVNNGTNAVLHTKHQSELIYKLRENIGANAGVHTMGGASFLERTDATNDTERQDVTTSFTSHTINNSAYQPAEFQRLHRFTIKKTVSGFDLGLDVHDGNGWAVKVGAGGSIASAFSVTSLPNTLSVIAFNDQGLNHGAGGGILPFIDVNITSLDLLASLLESQTVTVNGSATLSNGILDLPGASTDYASIPGSSNYDAAGDMTYSAWVYLDSLPAQQAAIMGNLQPNNWNHGFSIQIATGVASFASGIRIACNNGGGGNNKHDDFEPVGGVSLNAWHFVAMTRDSSTNTARAYFNGVEIGSISGATIGNNTGYNIIIGALKMGSGQANRAIDGQIQGVRIEQTLKSESELLEIYNAGPQ